MLYNAAFGLGGIVAFSKFGLGLSFTQGSVFKLAASYTVAIVGVLTFLKGNMKMLKETAVENNPPEEAESPHEKSQLHNYVQELKRIGSALPYTKVEVDCALGMYTELLRDKEALKRVAALNKNRSLALLMETYDETERYLEERLRQLLLRLVILSEMDKERYNTRYRNSVIDILTKTQAVMNQFDIFLEEASKMHSDEGIENLGLMSAIQALRTMRGAMGEDAQGIEDTDILPGNGDVHKERAYAQKDEKAQTSEKAPRAGGAASSVAVAILPDDTQSEEKAMTRE